MAPDASRFWPAQVLLVLLLSGPYLASQYADPPHPYVAQQNDALAPALLGQRIPAGGDRPRANPLRHFSIRIHAAYPSVDGLVSSAHPPRMLWGWSYDAQSDYDWEGGLTGCGTNRSRMSLSSASGQFRLVSELPGLSRVLENPPNPASSTFTASEMAASAGPLRVRVEGRLVLNYARETQTVQCRSFCYWNGCSTQSWVETTRDTAFFEYPAASQTVEQAVRHPANRVLSPTPWISNFSVHLPWLQAYLYSNTSLYWLESTLDGVRQGYRRTHGFEVYSDDRGALSIGSVANSSTDDSSAHFQPHGPKTFRHAYAVQQDLGSDLPPGPHSWHVLGRDFFGDSVEFRETFWSHDAARLAVAVPVQGLKAGRPILVSLGLTDRAGNALGGRSILLETPVGTHALATGPDGKATASLVFPNGGTFRIVARFAGGKGFAPVFADAVLYVAADHGVSGPDLRAYDGLLLGFTLLLGLCLVRLR